MKKHFKSSPLLGATDGACQSWSCDRGSFKPDHTSITDHLKHLMRPSVKAHLFFPLIRVSFLLMPKAAVSFVVQQISRSPLTPLTPLWLYLCTWPIHSTSPPHFTARRPAPFHDSLPSSPPPLTPAKTLTWGIPFLLSHFCNHPPQLSVSSGPLLDLSLAQNMLWF